MYTQFFGNYLLSNGYVNREQLFMAMQKRSEVRMKLGTLAIHSGYMTATEVDDIVIQQTHHDKKFGELAIESGYLSSDQVLELLNSQNPDFLLIGQILVDEGIITNTQLENIIADYRSQNEMFELEMALDDHSNLDKLFENFFISSEASISSLGRMYCELLFNNFFRFIGDDFTPLEITECEEFPVDKCVRQDVEGPYAVTSYLNMEESAAIEFASRYVGETFEEFDEFVQASMEDFLNLHNGLFIVNASNENSMELSIGAPEYIDSTILAFSTKSFDFPVIYPFGIVHFIMEVHSGAETI